MKHRLNALADNGPILYGRLRVVNEGLTQNVKIGVQT